MEEFTKSAKVKLFSIISAFVLVLGIMIIGVLSAEQVQVNIGGSVSFNATNVYARVSGNISGAQTGNKTFSTLTYSASETTGDESDWTNLALEFTETPDPIVITITVENLSTQRTLTANLTNSLSASGLNIAVTRDSASYASATNVELGTAGSSTDSTTFTLTLTVANLDEDLTDATFGYILNMFDESVEIPISDFIFTTSGDKATLTGYTGAGGDVVIPSTISLSADGTAIVGSDYTVTSIGNQVFWGCRGLESITIPLSVTSIGESVFVFCTSLTSIEVDPANTAFSSEEGVLFNKDKTILIQYPTGNTRTEYKIPDSVTSIGDGVFDGCTNLTSITIPEGVTTIGESAFYQCINLSSIKIPSSVTSIGGSAFYGCSGLTTITIPPNVESIGRAAFRLSHVNSVTIESEDIYRALTNQEACGELIANAYTAGDVVLVLKSMVDRVETDITANPVNTYLNGSNFTRSEEGDYYVYTHI